MHACFSSVFSDPSVCLKQNPVSTLSRPSYQCFFQGLKYLAEAAARGVNVVMKYLAQFLMAAGVDGKELLL